MSTPHHALHVFPSFVPGGSQVRTAAILDGLGGAWRHSVLSMDGKDEARAMVGSDVDLTMVPKPPGGRGFFGTLKALQGLLRELSPDLVCTYNWGAIETVLAVNSLGGLPVIHHEDGFGPDEAAGFKRRRIWMRRYLLKRVPAVVVPSHNLGRIARELWRVPERQLHVVPNGVDLSRFDGTATPGDPDLRAELGIPADAFVVGTVGHLRAEKNYPRLVDALAEARRLAPDADVRVLLVGDGDERATVEARAAALGVRDALHLAGHRADCAPAYRAMDVFCLSSDTEQMPISLVEAMASSLPAACTDVGDVRLMVPPEGADEVVPLDPTRGSADGPDASARALAARFVALAADPDRCARLGAAGRARAHADYALEVMLATYRDLYTGLLFDR